jgi:RecA-family ATPase
VHAEDRLTTPIADLLKNPDFKAGGDIVLVRAADVQVRKLEWTWYARLAKSALTLLEGPPDKGKSTILVDLAARTTRGSFMPGEVPTVGETRTPGTVVMLVAEDDLATTVKPRLLAANADCDRVFFLTATRDEKGVLVPFHLSDDGERLARKVREVDAALVILDPLVSFMGSRKGRRIDSYNDLDVRQSLQPLLDLKDTAVVGIRHYKKGKGTDPLEAGAGSIGFTAVARVMLAALVDPDDPDRYLLVVSKNNLVPKKDRATISYQIVPSDDPSIGRIAWGEVVQVTAADVLEAQAAPADSSRVSEAKTAAVTFLREHLKNGDLVASDDIIVAAEEAGFSERTLWRAKAKAGIKARKKGKTWFWYLPGTQPPLDPNGSQV